MKMMRALILIGIVLGLLCFAAFVIVGNIAQSENSKYCAEEIAKLPLRVGDPVSAAHAHLGEGRRIGTAGGTAEIEGLTKSSRRISNYCLFFVYGGDGGFFVYVDHEEKIEHIFYGHT
jgi:hypothetical protein